MAWFSVVRLALILRLLAPLLHESHASRAACKTIPDSRNYVQKCKETEPPMLRDLCAQASVRAQASMWRGLVIPEALSYNVLHVLAWSRVRALEERGC